MEDRFENSSSERDDLEAPAKGAISGVWVSESPSPSPEIEPPTEPAPDIAPPDELPPADMPQEAPPADLPVDMPTDTPNEITPPGGDYIGSAGSRTL